MEKQLCTLLIICFITQQYQVGGYTLETQKRNHVDFTLNHIKFNLYKSNTVNPDTWDIMDLLLEVDSSGYDPNQPTIFITHGWNDKPESIRLVDLRKALISAHPGINVFTVDWRVGAKAGYSTAVKHTDTVGKTIYDAIIILEYTMGASRSQMHLIGHSLGGHCSAAAGKRMKDPKVGRISGLDTPDMGVNVIDPDQTLDRTDADFVDEIHTHVSMTDKGHADFFPNGGLSMPGCGSGFNKFINMFTSLVKGKTGELAQLVACDHMKVIEYYTESVGSKDTHCTFSSTSCKNWKQYRDGSCNSKKTDNHMGYYSTKPATPQSYYLKTNAESPYCIL